MEIVPQTSLFDIYLNPEILKDVQAWADNAPQDAVDKVIEELKQDVPCPTDPSQS